MYQCLLFHHAFQSFQEGREEGCACLGRICPCLPIRNLEFIQSEKNNRAASLLRKKPGLGISSMIEATIKMTVPVEKKKEVLQTVRAILGPIRLERGCISCNCYEDVEDENILYFEEAWRNREDLEKHLRSDHFGVLNGTMGLLRGKPDIRFNTIAFTTGPEAIKAAQAMILS